MATRKLKFKQKPLIGGLVRRNREQEEVAESSNSTNVIQTAVKEDFKASELLTDELKSREAAYSNSESETNKTSEVQPEEALQSNILEDLNKQTDLISQNIHTADSSPPTPTSGNSINIELQSNEPATETLNTITESDTSNIKKDTNSLPKPLSKFGRSRCKPVLSNLGNRKKTEAAKEDNQKLSVDTSSTRTESVIKTVESEISKINPTVREITESFTSLEEEEELLPSIPQKQNSQEGDSIDRTNINRNCPLTTNNTKVNLELSSKSVIVDKPIKTSTVSDHDAAAILLEIKDRAVISKKVPISPHKATAKLVPKPSPRLSDAGSRRLSFQGSDSEEELKRKKHSVGNETDKITKNSKTEKKIKNNKRKLRNQGSTYSKMGQETMEKLALRFGKSEVPDKSQLKMIDLIFYNPKTNPMSEAHKKRPTSKKRQDEKKDQTENVEVQTRLAEEEVDDVEDSQSLPVPQLKVGPDGQIILDPQSLVIETTGTEKIRAELEKSEVVEDTGLTRYSTYSKKNHSRKDWSPQETLQFYRALNTIGTDFSLMCQLFPKRSRHELKLKFKKEERTNMHLIDKAITGPVKFDFKTLEEELKAENEEIAMKEMEKRMVQEAAKKERERRKEERLKEKEEMAKGQKQSSKKIIDRKKKVRYAVIKEFDEEVDFNVKKKDTKQSQKRKRKKIVKEERDSSDNEFQSEDEGLALVKLVKQKTHNLKPAKKLEEREEMNETLRRKLEPDSESEEDRYTFSIPESQMIFSDPLPERVSQPPPQDGLTYEIPSVPAIQSVLTNQNVEDVSEISELGSFGQNEDILDLSMPVRPSLDKDMVEDLTPTLDTHLISQSILIVDQLTDNIPPPPPSENPETIGDVLQEQNVEQSNREFVTLPSFETVGRSRESVIYSINNPYLPESQSTQTNSQECHHQESPMEVDSSTTEECILGQ